jgi:hypothetical protein
MITDINACHGHWPFRPLSGELTTVRDSLRAVGVTRICLSPLDAAWCRDPHVANARLYEEALAFEDVWPVPVMDPTVATWEAELGRAVAQPRVRIARLLPSYSPYPLEVADGLLTAMGQVGLAALVQTRLEDPRSQHPLALVPDLPAEAIVSAAERHPGVTLIIGGARTADLRALAGRIGSLPNLYADISQADGLDAVRLLVAEGLGEKLLFGSHAPFFIPQAALARVLDLEDAEAAPILAGNAARLLDGS